MGVRQKSPLSAGRTPACSADLASSRCEIGSSGSSPVLAAHLPVAFAAAAETVAVEAQEAAGAAGVEIEPAGAGIAAGGRAAECPAIPWAALAIVAGAAHDGRTAAATGAPDADL